MAKHKVLIVDVSQIKGTSTKSGKPVPYDMRFAQCVVTTVTKDEATGKDVERKIVGELMLPENLKETQPGEYIVEFEIAVGQDKRIGSKVVALTPLARVPQARAA